MYIQILDGECKGEYFTIDIDKFKEFVNFAVMMQDGIYKIFSCPKEYIKLMADDRRKRKELAIKQYLEDLKLWREHSERMWDYLIYGDIARK